MKKITLTFLTEKGIKAYEAVEEEGKRQSWKEKQISRKVCRDSVVCKDPLTVEIKVKIPRLAIQVDLPAQIKDGLNQKGAVIDKDYTMEIK